MGIKTIQPQLKQTLFILLGISLPFSIAIGNVLFAAILLLSVIHLQWWQGVQILRHHYPWLLRSWLAYMALFLAGLMWTSDLQWGLHLLSKQWSWLLVPAVVGLLMQRATSLTHHNLLTITIRAVSAGLLLHWGIQQHGWQRGACWAISLWSVVMVFLAQGRSGYLIVLVLTMVLARKLLFHSLPRLRFWLTAIVIGSIIAVTLWQSEALRHRLQWTANNLQQAEQGDLNHSEARLVMWYSAWRGWLEHPIMGVGTGGFPTLSQQMAEKYGLHYDGKTFAAHPHQMYLLDLARWGPLGVLALLAFLGAWIAIGWRNMEKSPYNTLIVASGVALAVHGLSAPSLEEYYGSVYGALFLAIGLAGMRIESQEETV